MQSPVCRLFSTEAPEYRKKLFGRQKKHGLIKINYGSDLRKEFIRTFGEAYEANHNEHDVIHLSIEAVKNVGNKAKELVMMINEH